MLPWIIGGIAIGGYAIYDNWRKEQLKQELIQRIEEALRRNRRNLYVDGIRFKLGQCTIEQLEKMLTEVEIFDGGDLGGWIESFFLEE